MDFYKFKLITAPEGYPVTLAEAKDQIRELADDQDDFISGQLIPAAVELCEQHMRRALVRRTYELALDAWPDTGIIRLPRPPALAVDSIKYTDTDGVEQTMAASAYQLDNYEQPAAVIPAAGTCWPSIKCGVVNPIKVRYSAGYDLLADSPVDYSAGVPRDIIHAILLTIADGYMWRENAVQGTIITKIPTTAENLMAPYRVWSL